MKFKDLEWHVPSIHGPYALKIQDVDKGYRISRGYWNGSGFAMVGDSLNAREFVQCFHFIGKIKN